MVTAVSFRSRIFASACGLAIALAALVSVALLMRGPLTASAPLPEMAAAPVLMSNGVSLYVQRYEITVAEWKLCHDQGGCALMLRGSAGLDPVTTPATGLSYADATEYVRWINEKTGHDFRLPTISEWEEMARSVLPEKADPLFSDPALTWATAYLVADTAPRRLLPQGSFSTTPEGISDLDGSVWEWTQDCYAGAIEEADLTRCPAYFAGGAHVAVIPYLVRDPARGGCAVGAPPAHLGLRLVSESPAGSM